MATYKEIKGITIQTLDTDPVENVGTWASGGSLNTAGDFRGTASVANVCAGGGTSASGIAAGQYTGSLTTNSEQWTASLANKTITTT